MLAAVFTRDRLTRQLSAAEQRYRALVEQIPAFPYVLDENEQVTFHVGRLSVMMGVPDDQPFGWDGLGGVDPSGRPRPGGRPPRGAISPPATRSTSSTASSCRTTA